MLNPKGNMEKDFFNFQTNDEFSPSEKLSKEILSFVGKDLCPTHKIVFFKLLSIHAFIGAVTLLFCPQFNLSFTNNHKLFHYFHHTFGSSICMLICGSIFLGSGAIFAVSILREVELKLIRANKYFYYLTLTSIALTTFLVFGAEIYLKMSFLWVIGAITSSLLVILSHQYYRIISQKKNS